MTWQGPTHNRIALGRSSPPITCLIEHEQDGSGYVGGDAERPRPFIRKTLNKWSFGIPSALLIYVSRGGGRVLVLGNHSFFFILPDTVPLPVP